MDCSGDEPNEPHLVNREIHEVEDNASEHEENYGNEPEPEQNNENEPQEVTLDGKRSEYWPHFLLVTDENCVIFAQCKYNCPS